MIPHPLIRRGFLPDEDPLRVFPGNSERSVLDETQRHVIL
jgi:hypothetical protein